MSGGYTVVAGAGAAAGGSTGTQGPPGSPGTNGTNGATINYGNGPPASTVGNTNDSYVDLTNYKYYPMKTTSGWTLAPFSMVGPQGTAGTAGTNGTNGSNGAAGTNGTNGVNGATIIYGSGAPTSGTGNVNDNYIDGTNKLFYPAKTASGWTNASFSIQGPQGTQGNAGTAGTNGTNGSQGTPGTNGSVIYSGSGGPGSGVGNIGDYYVDLTGYNFWGPKKSDGWSSLPFTMQGPAGTPAPQNCPGLYVINGQANWANASTTIATLPTLTYGATLLSATAYNGVGTQPSNFSMGFGATATILGSRSVSGMTSGQFVTYQPSGIGSMGTSGQAVIIAPVGGAVSGGGTARFDLLLTMH